MSSQRGQATVELALTLTVLVFLLFGIVDFGRAFHAYIALEHAGREASRVASIGGSNAEIIDAAQSASMGLNIADLVIEISPLNEAERTRGTQAEITIIYPFDVITPLVGRFFPENPFPLSSITVMRVE